MKLASQCKTKLSLNKLCCNHVSETKARVVTSCPASRFSRLPAALRPACHWSSWKLQGQHTAGLRPRKPSQVLAFGPHRGGVASVKKNHLVKLPLSPAPKGFLRGEADIKPPASWEHQLNPWLGSRFHKHSLNLGLS